jgi:rhodanese-related sulfurtransferase
MSLVEASAMTHDVIDVRQASEYASGHVPGAINIELGSLMGTSVTGGPKIMMCGHGERAMTAASILAASGHDEVAVLHGGPESWSAVTGRQLERSS